jgi:hypothetical protein
MRYSSLRISETWEAGCDNAVDLSRYPFYRVEELQTDIDSAERLFRGSHVAVNDFVPNDPEFMRCFPETRRKIEPFYLP